MKQEKVLNQIKGKLIVSCQARVGWAMYGSDIMTAFSVAAQEGGASGIRASGKDNIVAIKKAVDLPLIGINKKWIDGYDVYITPTYQSAVEILEVGIDIIALDATPRRRPDDETFETIVSKIKENYPDVLIMGEIATVEEAIRILDSGIDLLSTTLNGYTEETKNSKTLSIDLIKDIKQVTSIPIIAEGRIDTPERALEVMMAGAFAVVVGTAITRPEVLTKRFVEVLKSD